MDTTQSINLFSQAMIEENQNLPIWQLVLAILVPTLITAIPSIISAIYAIRAGNRNLALQAENSRLEHEKLDFQRKESEGQYTNDVVDGYNKLAADLRLEREQMKQEREELREELRICKEKFTKWEDEKKSLEKRISTLESGVRKLLKQLKTLAPDVIPAFEIEEK